MDLSKTKFYSLFQSGPQKEFTPQEDVLLKEWQKFTGECKSYVEQTRKRVPKVDFKINTEVSNHGFFAQTASQRHSFNSNS